MHTELESTKGKNYYDCTCLSPVPSFTFLPSSNYTIYGDYIFLNCDQSGVYIPINIDASATQYENAYEVTVEEVTTGTSYTKVYYGTASTINLQYIFPNIQVNRVYRVRLNSINTCSKQYTEKFINVQYNIGCGGFFLRASPNPASQTITIDYGIEVEKETDTELWMIEFNNPSKQNIIKTKSKQSKGTYQEQINVNGLKNGLYLVTLKTPEKSISQKIEILH